MQFPMAAMATPKTPGAMTQVLHGLRPYAGPGAVVGLLVAVTAVVVVRTRTRAVLRTRRQLRVVPTLSFDPSMDEVRRWAAVLGTSRRAVGGLASRRAEAIRFRLGVDEDRRVGLSVESTPRTLRLAEAGVMRECELLRSPELGAAENEADAGVGMGEGAPQAPPFDRRGRRRRRLGIVGALAEAVEVGEANAHLVRGSAHLVSDPRAEDTIEMPVLTQAMIEDRDMDFAPSSEVGETMIPQPRVHVARREMRLAKGSALPLGELALSPDPLAPFVAVLGALALGEDLEVVIDLQPLGPTQRRILHRRAQRRDHSPNTSGFANEMHGSLMADPLRGGGRRLASRNTGTDLMRLEDRAQDKDRHNKLASGDAAFESQVLIKAQAATPGRARALVDEAAACFAPFAGPRNRWRATGWGLGPIYVGGAQAVNRRRSFDRRWETGRFHPHHPSVVIASEVAALIKPPTKNCAGSAIVRSGGLVPEPPVGLPAWTPEDSATIMPLGWVTEHGVRSVRGVPIDSTLFTARFGRSGMGKTETALVAAIGLARMAGVSVLFCDPHGDALDRMTPYLLEQADRLLEVNLSREACGTQAGWNPLAMGGAGGVGANGPNAIEEKSSMIAAAFAAFLGWTEQNNRGMNLVTQAAQSLCELNLVLPPDCQATIFQIITILSNDDWRNDVLRFLSPNSQSFWLTRFTKQTGGGEAITPVTNALDRIRSSRHIAALFGQSISTFDMRQAMDDGKIILLCPGGVGDKENLIHALFLFELFRATLSRRNLAPERRRACHAFLDEMQVADRGQSSIFVSRMFQEARKYAVRVHAMVQQPTALSKTTLRAMLTNRSHLFSTVLAADDGALVAREWGGVVEPSTITSQLRYEYLASVTLGDRISDPFRVKGLSVEEAWGPAPAEATAAAMEEAIDHNMARRPVDEVLTDLDTLDARILEALAARRPDLTVPPPSAPRRRRRDDAAVAANVHSIRRAGPQ